MKREELIDPTLGGGLTGAVNTDVMSEVELREHGRLWHLAHNLLNLIGRFFGRTF